MMRASKCNTRLILSFALTTVSAYATTIDFAALRTPEATNSLSASNSVPPSTASSIPDVLPDPSAVSATFEDIAASGEPTYFATSDEGMRLIDPDLFSSLESVPEFSPEEYFVDVIAGFGIGGPQQQAATQTSPQSGPVPEPSSAVMTGTSILVLMWAQRKRRSHLRSGAILC
jgi:hypothetical protein